RCFRHRPWYIRHAGFFPAPWEGQMKFLHPKSSLTIAALAAALTCAIPPVAHAQAPAQSASPPADAASSDLVRIEYVPPKDPKHQTAYKLVQQRGALEMMKKVFTPLRVPVPVTIKTIGCDGVSNA